ncbi:hypothetical protein BJL95_21190 [Methylomonas sp. LWB]|uniref:FecR family protein n=1 Tax=Methylomonas sp. LWB TaxID=1905845 RepID=UPI0008D9AD7C|nr:FecR family protein [Methylomonas sp. LWB]OHX37186.1 hypothetical protein BJL95_21190 [Methylomonas sp. LWB]
MNSTNSDERDARIRREASAWLARLNSGDCSTDDRAGFEAWLAMDTRHADAFRRAERLWRELAGLGEVARPQLKQAQAVYRHARRKRRWPMAGLAAAALLAGVLIVNPPIWQWLTAERFTTGKGERETVTLSDGSSIELNTDTAIRVNYSARARRVWLERGEAWFNVAHNNLTRFEVRVGEGWIEDIGTQFNVRRDPANLDVAVQEGEVAVQVATNPEVLHLTAGQQTNFDRQGRAAPVRAGDLAAIAAWRGGVLVLKNLTLADVARELERYHAVSIEIADADLRQLSVSGRFPTDNLPLALNTIATALPVRIAYLDGNRIGILARR